MNTQSPGRWRLGIGLSLLAALMPAASAQDSFPSKTLRIVVPSAPGGALDLGARLIAQKMGERLGQSVIVDNRPGADSLLGTRLVKNAPPDGYTLLAHTSTLTLLPSFKANLDVDVLRDFAPIGPAQRSPSVIAVGAEMKVRNFEELRQLNRQQQITYASAGVGSTGHICAAALGLQQQMNLMHVPYKGAAAAMPDVASGRVGLTCAGLGGVAPYLQTGHMRVLGVTDAKRMASAPELPTLKEQGIDFSYTFWLGLLAPAGTPKATVDKLSAALRFAAKDKEVRARFAESGAETWTSTPEQFREHLARELADTAALVKALNIAKE
jgi:tripartite-type tricarboxylate transporter receptor subunit TctC